MKPLAITPATKALDERGLSYTLHKFESSTNRGFGQEASISMGIDPRRIFKTILFTDSQEIVVGVSPVEWDISTKKLASALGLRSVSPAPVSAAERAPGYVVGGISPFGQKRAHRTVLDDSAWDYPTIYVSGGRRGLEIELTPDDFVTALTAVRSAIAAREPSTN